MTDEQLTRFVDSKCGTTSTASGNGGSNGFGGFHPIGKHNGHMPQP